MKNIVVLDNNSTKCNFKLYDFNKLLLAPTIIAFKDHYSILYAILL